MYLTKCFATIEKLENLSKSSFTYTSDSLRYFGSVNLPPSRLKETLKKAIPASQAFANLIWQRHEFYTACAEIAYLLLTPNVQTCSTLNACIHLREVYDSDTTQLFACLSGIKAFHFYNIATIDEFWGSFIF